MSGAANSPLGISVVVPVHQGVDYLQELVVELEKVAMELDTAASPLRLREAVFVDDGSSDGSEHLLDRLEARYPWIRVIHLSRNFGQHAATATGIRHTAGDWVATLDEDLQHHPRFLLTLLARAVSQRADLAYASPTGGVHRTYYRNLTSRLYKFVMRWLAGNSNTLLFNSFRMIRGTVARAAAEVMGSESYLDVALSWFTQRVVVQRLPLRDLRDEAGGRSGYGLRALLGHARRMFVSSQVKPLRLGAAVGSVALLLSTAGSIAVVIIKLVAPGLIEVRGWTSLILAIMFFGGLSLLLLGIVLEYLTIVLLDSQGRPRSFVVDRSSDEGLRKFLQAHLPGEE